jgi:vacuolar protein sorting-associated protein 54
MDTVEVHRIDSISLVSVSFFTTLKFLREVHSEAIESVERIQKLRQDLIYLDENLASRGIEILKKRQKHKNLQQLLDVLLQLKWVVNGVASCESLVDDEDVENALVKIAAVELLMVGERDEIPGEKTSPRIQLRDMREAEALQRMARVLTILCFRIGKILESKLQSLLIGDLRHHVQAVSKREVLMRWESASLRAKGNQATEALAFPTYMSVTNELCTALLHIISGLHRSKYISTAIQAYRDLVLLEIRNIVRKPLPSSSDDGESVMSRSTISGGRGRTNHDKSSTLAQNLRALDVEDAEMLFPTIFIGVAETLRRLKTQSSLLLDINYSIRDINGYPVQSPGIRSPNRNPISAGNTSSFEIQEDIHTALDLTELLGQAVDLAHEKIKKILRVRSEQVRGLSLTHFLRYFTLNLLLCQRMRSHLRAARDISEDCCRRPY